MKNMSWIKLKSICIIFLINLKVLLLLLIFLELFQFFVNPLNKESYRITYNYDWILYNYCPNVVDVKRNTKDDGGKVVFTYANDIGQRVEKLSMAEPNNPEHVFIGDSFIQAEEMEFQETFYGRLRSLGYRVSSMGYSSWNIIQYREAIKKLAYVDTHYHVFLMANDITPAYSRSVYREKLDSPARKIDTNTQPSFQAKISKAYDNSLTKILLDAVTKLRAKSKFSSLAPIKTTAFDIDNIKDCRPLDEIDDAYRDLLGYDYLVYSKDFLCWPEIHKKAADQALEEIHLLIDQVSNLNSTLTFYIIPPGWSFANQNSKGRLDNSYYFFGNEIKVTTAPLTTYLSSKLPGVDFVSLENLLLVWLSDCKHCKDQFYYADDGHWTPLTHYKLADYLIKSSTFQKIPNSN
jgi:hypothetical protein